MLPVPQGSHMLLSVRGSVQAEFAYNKYFSLHALQEAGQVQPGCYLSFRLRMKRLCDPQSPRQSWCCTRSEMFS